MIRYPKVFIYRYLTKSMKLKLQKQVSRKHEDKTYYKYVVIIPMETIKKHGLEDWEWINVEVGK